MNPLVSLLNYLVTVFALVVIVFVNHTHEPLGVHVRAEKLRQPHRPDRDTSLLAPPPPAGGWCIWLYHSSPLGTPPMRPHPSHGCVMWCRQPGWSQG